MPAMDTLREIWAHHAWADAEHWRAFEAFPHALADAALFARLHHLHLTQSAWIWAISDRRHEFVFSKPGDFTPDTLKDFAMANHQALALSAALDESDLERRIGIPWFTDPPVQVSVSEGLTQVAMHSHYHRGQNATRFRELGGDPPGTDLIAWIWKGRPAAVWLAHESVGDPRAARTKGIVCRAAFAPEQKALEDLQRRASLSNAGDRAALLANPDAIELPLHQILNGQVFVAEKEGVTLGFAALLPREDGAMELDALFVEPHLWKQGIGRLLVQHCAAVAAMKGSTALHVIGNPHAEGFYEACGFERTGIVQTRFGVGLAFRRML